MHANDLASLNLSQVNGHQLSYQQKAQLRKSLEQGLPLVSQPYVELANAIGSTEVEVLNQIEDWRQEGLIKRFGFVVKHRQLGYTANAMVVWDIPSDEVDHVAGLLAKRKEISLCYRRPRRQPDWPYNLFCMIHGQNRATVEQQIENISRELSLTHINKHVLFSNKAYKQNGARYGQRKA